MKFKRLHSWLSFLGQIAVLAGLVALAIEIRGNTLAVRAQELAANSDRKAERILAMIDPGFEAMYTKALYKPDELTLEEIVVVNTSLSYRVFELKSAYTGFHNGVLRESDWIADVENMPIFLGTNFGRGWWQFHKHDYASSPTFVDAIDESLNKSTVMPDDQYYLELQKQIGKKD